MKSLRGRLVGAGSPANTGKARAIHPTVGFAGNPAPSDDASPIKKPATRAGFFTAIRITPDEPVQPACPSGRARRRRKQSGLLSGS
ncbi:hypothetical protein EZZ80_15910 [Pseudomonas putida]|nr:hypothetical protein DM483_08240 [Pseudomonas sp. SMT-1]QDW58684.1 hypothetical protein FFH79_018235 [Pseudomonas sp. KBS0802]UZA74894.1 hypothetical protein EZZ80_15910 [Pseudomonas putida]